MTIASEDSVLADHLVAKLTGRFDRRLLVVSPPRTASTPVARILWQHDAITHHCHEPFEASYWGGADASTTVLGRPMEIVGGQRVELDEVEPPAGLLIKEMSFQLDDAQFRSLAALATAPVVFVVRDPVLATTSRLRIVRELYDEHTFPPYESGWQAVGEQVLSCQQLDIPYLIVDSDDLRADPVGVSQSLLTGLDLPDQPDVQSWLPRPGMQLCTPQVGALMSDKRTADDPFYRRVLSSRGVQPADPVDREGAEVLIAAAGLTDEVAGWSRLHERLRADPHLLGAGYRTVMNAGKGAV